jgi:hypothetical protein
MKKRPKFILKKRPKFILKKRPKFIHFKKGQQPFGHRSGYDGR